MRAPALGALSTMLYPCGCRARGPVARHPLTCALHPTTQEASPVNIGHPTTPRTTTTPRVDALIAYHLSRLERLSEGGEVADRGGAST